MRYTRHFRQPFDPRCDFVHLKDAKFSGVQVAAGDPVDRGTITPRRLRQLYDSRAIAYAPGQAPAPRPPKPLAIGPTDLANYGEARPPERAKKRGIARRAA